MSSSVPLISVLMPAYNHESYIQSAIESVLNQSCADFELIVVDDASTDATWSVLERIHDDRLSRVRHAVNRGAHATLNEALELSRGRYISIINSDDLYDKYRLERLLDSVTCHGDGPILAFSDVTFIDEVGDSIQNHPRAREYHGLRLYCEGVPALMWFLAGNVAVSTSNFFFSRCLLEKYGFFRPLRYTHDWDWALRVSASVAPIWVREALLCYRVHASNTLSESDSWRHVHENSYIQAQALLAMMQSGKPGFQDEESARAVFLALLDNRSLHPLSLLCFLVLGLSGLPDTHLLKIADRKDDGWMIENLADRAGLPHAVFLSLREMAAKEEGYQAQARMITERLSIIQHMDQEIANRDKWIADLQTLINEQKVRIRVQEDDIVLRNGNIGELEQRVALLKAALDRINSHPVIRGLRMIKRLLGVGS